MDSPAPLATKAFSLPAHGKLASSIDQLFNTATFDQLANARYATFTATTPVNAAIVDPHNPQGRIAGIGVNATFTWDGGLHIESNTIESIDDYRILLETNRYNARTRTDYFELNDGPATLNLTVIGKDNRVTGATYNPRADGQLNTAMSATFTTNLADRQFYATANTVTGVNIVDFPLARFITQLTDNTYNPLFTINSVDAQKYQQNVPMTLLAEDNPDVDLIKGKGYSYNAIQQDPGGLALLMYANRDAFVDASYQNLPLENWINGFKSLTSDGNPGRLERAQLFDSGMNGFAYRTVNQAPGQFYYFAIQQTFAGELFMDALKNFFDVGYEWVDRPTRFP